ncbi:MAG: hypothetical protein ABI415_05165 [Flavitalea sp.]
MKRIYILLAFTTMFLVGCTKRDILYTPVDNNDWIHSHEKGIVSYVDYYSGNYIVDTYNGYAVVELRGTVAPHIYDEEYAYFGSRGRQTTYNYTANYFTDIGVVESYLSWQDARYVLDQLSGNY